MDPDVLELKLQERLDALPKAARAELLHVLTLPDFDRVGMIQTCWGNPETHTFGELLIDCGEYRTLRAVLVGILREIEREESPRGPSSLAPLGRLPRSSI